MHCDSDSEYFESSVSQQDYSQSTVQDDLEGEHSISEIISETDFELDSELTFELVSELSTDESDNSSNEDEHEVAEIEDHGYDSETKQFKYKVRWKGYPEECNKTWHTIENLEDAMDAVNDYHELIGHIPDPKKAKHRKWEGFEAECKNGDLSSKWSETACERSSQLFCGSPTPNKTLSQSSNVDEESYQWDTNVEYVKTLERVVNKSTGESELWATVTWKSKHRKNTKHPVKLLYEKAPMIMFEFYERHLVITTEGNKNVEVEDSDFPSALSEQESWDDE